MGSPSMWLSTMRLEAPEDAGCSWWMDGRTVGRARTLGGKSRSGEALTGRLGLQRLWGLRGGLGGGGGPGTWKWVWGLEFQSGAEDLRVGSDSLGTLGSRIIFLEWEDYIFGGGQSTKAEDSGWPSLTLQGCAAAGCPAEGGADAGPPSLDSEVAPGSVAPPPQTWGPLFAESELAPPPGSDTGASCWLSCS